MKNETWKEDFMKKITLFLLTILISIGITGCSSILGKDSNTVVIGGKNFTEQDILVYLMKDVIEAKTKVKVETKAYLGGTNVVAQALERGDLDIYVEYTGTGLMNILGEPTAPNDPQIAYNKVKEMYAIQKQIVWLKPLGFNNGYTLSMRADQAKELGIETISDLAKQSGNLKLGATHEFLERIDGYQKVKAVYGMNFSSPAGMDPGLTYAACRDGNVDVIDAYSTDGRIPAFNLKILTDNEKVFPSYHASPLIRADTLKNHPEIADALNLLAGKLTDEEMTTLNARVEIDGESAQNVASQWLKKKGII